MSKEISDPTSNGDILDWMHALGKQRDQIVPDFDIEQTMRFVRAIRDISAGEAAAVNFWNALTTADQGDLVSAAQKQTFHAGSVLMREGERAETVMVILDGHVKVRVDDQGRERVIADRRPGDVIGESGAEPGGVRNATVVATEPVLALVLTTENYRAFVSEHPDLPLIVKQQTWDRTTDPNPGA
ncbi:MAG TPA: cyclic nucleotide-binding domain-containing protein [Streptosporangiaceae bacterium]|jgi:signal-transduction protein with cAMP-binding, CBS, and nucleotidyltransferase domain|nr:cyclic nucleotide-binding domain-containing protein [Streptosporangiaceae bacterium]